MSEYIQYDFDIMNESGVLRITLRGAIDGASAHQITTEAINIATEHDLTHFLYDLREAQLNMGLTELYSLPRQFPASQVHRIAALIKKSDDRIDDWQFLEDVERNIGIQMQLCTSEQEALDWLASK